MDATIIVNLNPSMNMSDGRSDMDIPELFEPMLKNAENIAVPNAEPK